MKKGDVIEFMIEFISIKDLANSVVEEGVSSALDSENLSEIIADVADVVLSEGTSLIVGNILGAVAPRINSIRQNYKQNRFERNVREALTIFSERINELELNFKNLNSDMKEKFNGLYLEWFLDNLYSERQVSKVPYHVNGFINFMNNDSNDNIMIMFFDTLNQLTQLDIDALKMYDINSPENYNSLMERYNLLPEQIEMIREKLARLGLLYSKNDDQRDSNIDTIVDYLKKVDKDAKTKKPKGVKLPNIKKPNKTERYSITGLGRSYLKTIENTK